MRALFGFLIVMFVFHTGSNLALASEVNPICAEMLIARATSDQESFRPWSELPQALEMRQAATLWLRLPASSLSHTLSSISTLGLDPSTGLEIPPELMVINGQGVFVVLKGEVLKLLEAAPELAKRFPGLSFQVLGSSDLRFNFELPTPGFVIEVKAQANQSDLEAQLKKLNLRDSSYIIFDGRTAQFSYVFPEADLAGVGESLLQALGIRSAPINKGETVLDWIRENARLPGFGYGIKKGQRILTQEAFLALKKVEGWASATDSPAAKDLNSCPEEVCVTTVKSQSLNSNFEVDTQGEALLRDLSNGHLKSMIEALSEISGRGLTGGGGFYRAVERASAILLPASRAKALMKSFEELSPADYDGRFLRVYLEDGSGRIPTIRRFTMTWKLFAEALDPELVGQSFDSTYAEKSLATFLQTTKRPQKAKSRLAKKAKASDELPLKSEANEVDAKPTSNSADLKKIYVFMKELDPSFRAYKPGMLTEAFKQLLKRVGAPEESFKALDELGLRPSDAIHAVKPAILDRIMAAWSLFADQVLTLENRSVEQVIAAYHDRGRPRFTAAKKRAAQAIDESTRDAILNFLKSASPVNLTEPFGLKNAFGAAVKSLRPEAVAYATFIQAFKEIPFVKSDYYSLWNEKSPSPDRLAKAFGLLQQLLKDPDFDQPLNPESVENTAKLYRKARGIPEPVLLVQESNSVPAHRNKMGRPDLVLSKEAHRQLIDLALRPDEINHMMIDWHGMLLNNGLSNHPPGTIWTLLFRSAEVMKKTGYSRDDAYVAVVQNGVITEILSTDEESEAKFYTQVSPRMGLKKVVADIKVEGFRRSDFLSGPLAVSSNVAAKLILKHRLTVEDVFERLKSLEIEKTGERDCYTLKVKGAPSYSSERYMLCTAPEEGMIYLRTFFRIR